MKKILLNVGPSIKTSYETQRISDVTLPGCGVTPPSNQLPSANAGADRSLPAGTTSVTLTGTGTDADGTIKTFGWLQTAGNSATIVSPSAATTNVTGLATGSYTFQLKVTDDKGGIGTDNVVITVIDTGGTATRNLIYEDGFEGSNPFAKYGDNTQSCCESGGNCCAYNRQVIQDGREGSQSFGAEVRQGDKQAHGGWRDELVPQYPGGDAGDMWYGFSLKFLAPVSGGFWTGSYGGHFVQWHPNNSGGSLMFGLWGSDGFWDMVVNVEGDATANHYYTGGTSPGAGTKTRIEAEKWFDIVMHLNYDTGLIEWWRDGVLQNRITVSWQLGMYFKFGPNRWGNCNSGPCDTWKLQYDNLRIARNTTSSPAGYNDVKPGN